VLCVPDEDSARGSIRFNLPTFVEECLIKDVSVSFGGDGIVKECSGSENFDEKFRLPFEREKSPGKGKPGLLYLGLNPRQKTGFWFDDASEGVVTLGIGHFAHGDINGGRFRFYGYLKGASVSIDDQTIFKNGKLAAF
jgi:leucyl aminopeptidase (aminopeptidase T)